MLLLLVLKNVNEKVVAAFFNTETPSFLELKEFSEDSVGVAQTSLGLCVSLPEEALLSCRSLRVH